MTALSVNMNIDTGEKTWLTPPHIIDALGPFDLDPCCPPQMPWRTAARMICRPFDGLAVDWTGQRVWLNPPYGREAVPFFEKLVREINREYKEDGFINMPTIQAFNKLVDELSKMETEDTIVDQVDDILYYVKENRL
jgi:hypothetical protein